MICHCSSGSSQNGKKNVIHASRATGRIPAPGTEAMAAFQADQLRRRIEQRAYELYEQRGCIDGHDLDDWRAAEAQVMAESAMANHNAA
jgi:hypothetical protein